jgi:hypothetical protein
MVKMELPKTDYSPEFDEFRKNRVAVSRHKYGSAAINFGQGLVDAVGSAEKCLEKYKQTKNTEYLVDAANYCMFGWMYPPPGAFFRATSSNESAGIAGISINEMEALKNENC